jgi:hypothetical protein
MRFSSAKNWVLLLAVVLAISACGREPKLEIGREFEPYVERFKLKGNEVGKPVSVNDLIVKFGQTEPKQDGVCETSDHTTPTIIINERAWRQMEDLGRESLMFHELGHCILGRSHVMIMNADEPNVPSSLMYPVAINLSIYAEKRDYYVRELFKALAI